MKLKEIKVGDRIKVNHTCAEFYWDIKATVINVETVEEHDTKDDFLIEIKFDIPLGTLKGEFFTPEELDKL